MRNLLRAAIVVAALAPALRAEAFPAFAKKYGMSCSACHVAWPIFNPQGQHFRDMGFQFGLGKDDPVTKSPDYLPIALRTTPAYQFTRMTNQPSDRGPITVTTGGVPVPPGLDILSGGTIAKDVSFLVVVSGFSPADNGAGLESAWARLDNLFGSGWANLRIGKFELDEPASAHRGVALTYGYAVYDAHPTGSLVGFDYGENQVGVELDGHDDRSMTRYSLSFTSANEGEGLSGNGWSSPMVNAHVQQAFELGNTVLPWARVGLLGAVGWWPTKFDTIGADPADPVTTPGTPIPGTGRDHKKFYRAGVDLTWMLGYPSTPALFTAAWMYGREEKGLMQGTDPVSGADLSARTGQFNGGFLELDWVPVVEKSYLGTPWLLFARWDVVRYQNGGVGDTDGATVGVRRYLALGPRASAAIHIEGHYDHVKAVGASNLNGGAPRTVETQAALAGIDFDY